MLGVQGLRPLQELQCENGILYLLEPSHRPAHAGCHHPRLRLKEENLIHSHLEQGPQRSRIRPLSSKDPLYTVPLLSCLSQVSHYFRPVII